MSHCFGRFNVESIAADSVLHFKFGGCTLLSVVHGARTIVRLVFLLGYISFMGGVIPENSRLIWELCYVFVVWSVIKQIRQHVTKINMDFCCSSHQVFYCSTFDTTNLDLFIYFPLSPKLIHFSCTTAASFVIHSHTNWNWAP